ncbi:MAG: cation:dicarboxylase symporter family transporter [Bacteroidota bacterium]
MRRREDNLKVRKQVASFVLPLGSTLNMDGTAIYLSASVIFLANIYGVDISLMRQLGIVVSITLISFGAAAVPSASVAMLAIALEQINVPVEAIGLILILDRPLDMLRTAVNVTSDAAIATILDKA